MPDVLGWRWEGNTTITWDVQLSGDVFSFKARGRLALFLAANVIGLSLLGFSEAAMNLLPFLYSLSNEEACGGDTICSTNWGKNGLHLQIVLRDKPGSKGFIVLGFKSSTKKDSLEQG